MNKTELVLTASGTVLQAGLIVVLWLRGSYRQFPWFFAFNAAVVLQAIACMAVRNHFVAYFKVYWAGEALATIFAFFALYEVFHRVFVSFFAVRFFKLVFPVAGLLILTVGVLRAVFGHPENASPVVAWIISSVIAVNFLQMGIFALFFLLAKFFRLSWKQHAFGIAFGYGIAAAGPLVAFLLRSEFGTKFHYLVRIALPIAYTIALAVWLATFLVRESAPLKQDVTSGLTPEQMVSDLKRYTAVAKRIFRQ